jgi:hypothetical protein
MNCFNIGDRGLIMAVQTSNFAGMRSVSYNLYYMLGEEPRSAYVSC